MSKYLINLFALVLLVGGFISMYWYDVSDPMTAHYDLIGYLLGFAGVGVLVAEAVVD